jgi:hypothetical protein
MSKIISALQTSVDGFIKLPNGEFDWAMAVQKRGGEIASYL